LKNKKRLIKMDKTKLKKKNTEKKVVPIHIKITKRRSEWLKKMDYSPTKLLTEICEQLGFKE